MKTGKNSAFFKPADESKDAPVSSALSLSPSAVQDYCASLFNRIRPEESKEIKFAELRGNCEECTHQVVEFLWNRKHEIKEVTPENTEFYFLNSDHKNSFRKVFSTEEPDEEDKAKEPADIRVFNYLNDPKCPPGSIFALDSEDHSCVIFKSFANNIYLFDSDSHYYRLITGPECFETDSEIVFKNFDQDEFESSSKLTRKEGRYNYIFDNEDDQVIIHRFKKLADPAWQDLEKCIIEFEKASELRLDRPAG